FVIRAPMGVFATPMYPAASRAVAHWLPFARRSSANGLVQGAAMLGIATTPLLFGHLIDRVGWPNAFLIIGVITTAVGLLWLWYGRNDPVEHSGVNDTELHLIKDGVAEPAKLRLAALTPTESGPWLDLLRNRSLVLLTISYAAVGYFEYLFNFWTQYYFLDVRHVDKETSRYFTLVMSLSMAAGGFLGGGATDILVRRFGIRLGRALVPVAVMLAWCALLMADVR